MNKYYNYKMMKKVGLLAFAVLNIVSVTSAATRTPIYTYEYPTDWIKLGAGAIAGVFTAGMTEASDNLCFNNAVSVADTAIDYSLTSLTDKQSTLDWVLWGGASIGGVVAISAKAAYYCLGTDPNFGWIKPVDYTNADL